MPPLQFSTGFRTSPHGVELGGDSLEIMKFPGYPEFINDQDFTKGLLKSNQCLDTFTALENLIKHKPGCSRLTEFLAIKSEIDQRLHKYSPAVNNWLMVNFNQFVRSGVGEQAYKLQGWISKLDLDALSGLKESDRNIISLTCRIAIDNGQPQRLVPWLLGTSRQDEPGAFTTIGAFWERLIIFDISVAKGACTLRAACFETRIAFIISRCKRF
jgi:hypothetical protein